MDSGIDRLRRRLSGKGKGKQPELTALLLLAGLLAAALVIALTARHPIVGGALLAVGVPLTTALGRGTVIPVLRLNEAILLLVLAGLTLHYLLSSRRVLLIGVDLAIASYAIGTVLIPWLVLLFARVDLDFDAWRTVLGPLQFLAVYLCFAQLRASDHDLKWLLNLTLLVSVILGLIAVLQLQDFPPGIRALVSSYFPPDRPLPGYYRPTSLLGNYGAVGAMAMLNFILALALASRKTSKLGETWLTAVMVVNLAALIASLTWAPALALALGAVIVIGYLRSLPRQIWISAAALVLVLAILWPWVSDRIEGQRISLGSIENVDTRLRNWQMYFLPVLAEHPWFGTGTQLPGELPPDLAYFVDNEFLRIGFRAGLVGIGLLIAMFTAVGVTAWRIRESLDPWLRRLGAVSLATVVMVMLVGFTAEYLSFGGLSQYIAMMFGLLAARIRHPAPSLREMPERASIRRMAPAPVSMVYRYPGET